MRLVHKVMDFDVDRVDEQARTFWAVASTEGPDRAGDVVSADGWDLANYRKNPVIVWAHDYSRPPVAKALAVKVEDGRLVFQAQFPTASEHAFADTVFQLYRGGYLRAFSVGFTPSQSEIVTHQMDGRTVTGTHYQRQELYEISCVTLPANPEALVAAGLGRRPGQAGPPLPAEQAAARKALAAGALKGLVASRLAWHLGRK
jgi:HK97 family phage prohead protease